LASLQGSNLPWPLSLTGFLVGLLYLGIAMWRYQPIEGLNPDVPGVMKTADNGRAFRESSTGILSESKTGVLERVPSIAEKDIPIGRVAAPVIPGSEAPPPLEKASEGKDSRRKRESAVREALAQTGMGGHFETLKSNDAASVMDNQKNAPSRNLEDLAKVVGDNIRDPDMWMAHTKAARVALELNDLDTAIKEIRLAIAVAPEKLKAWLESFLVQLENDRRSLPDASHSENPGGKTAEDIIARAIAKPVIRVNVEGFHPVLGRLIGPKEDE
jgi:hypothetical protein